MDDYYELLEVAPDAGREDIRGAYRAKRDELQAREGDQNRSKIAELNRAWNVLSDPTQRERYDDRLAEHRESDDDEDDGNDDEYDDGDERPARPVRSKRSKRSERSVPVTRAQRRDEARQARGKKQKPLVLPKGLVQAPMRSRLTAFAVDALLLIMIFLAVYISGVHQVTNHYPVEEARLKVLATQQKSIDNKVDADDKALSAAKKSNDAAAEKTATTKQTADKKTQSHVVDEINTIDRKIAPAGKLVYAIGVFAIFLYLVPSTALSGQTIGKRLQKIRVVKLADGSIPGWKTALLRFGVPLLVGLILGVVLLGPIGLVIALIGMIGWVTHPNQTGMHDRLAKTVVVEV